MCLSVLVHRPDVLLSEGTHLGFKWTVTHNGLGHRCGYVRVPKGHPWHGEEYDRIEADVHGGLTFAHPDMPCGKDGPEEDYWVGFDCAHIGDLPDPDLPVDHKSSREISNMFHSSGGGFPQSVKTQAYVEAECRSLCEQALAVVYKPEA